MSGEVSTHPPQSPADQRALVAIDLGAESCRVSLLRWSDNTPVIELVHRFPNHAIERPDGLRWNLQHILAELKQGLAACAEIATEGIRSIAVDGWAVDYVHLDAHNNPVADPFCYRDERTLASEPNLHHRLSPERMREVTGIQLLRINTAYQLFADSDEHRALPWLNLPEYILQALGGRPVSELTNASHTQLLDLNGQWSPEIFAAVNASLTSAPTLVPPGTDLGPLTGPLSALPAFANTRLIAPACHDTASAIAGIPSSLDSTLYISSGTWSLVGTRSRVPVTTPGAFAAGYTNLGAATGDLLVHSLINSMWVLKQCMDAWAAESRPWNIEDLIQQASAVTVPALLDMDGETLMLDTNMPARINTELVRLGNAPIPDIPGNEPLFARLIFESLAARYASALSSLEHMLGRKLTRIHILGGASRNKLLTQLTAQRTGLPVEIGHPESTTIGNFAVQLAASEAVGQPIDPASIRNWAAVLCGPQH